MNQLNSILNNDDLAREIARKVPLVQTGEASSSTGGSENVLEGSENAIEKKETVVSENPVVIVTEPVHPDAESGEESRDAINFAVSGEGLNEAIVKRFGRPVLMIRNDTFEIPAADFWKSILFPYKNRIDAAIPSVGRVEIVSTMPPYIGTAWMIDKDIAVTNRHVALEFAQPVTGGNGFEIRRNPIGQQMRVRVDFKEEYLQTVPFEAEVVEVLYIAPPIDNQPDIALIRLRSTNQSPLPPPIALFDGEPSVGQKIGTIGYPAEDWRNGAADQARIFANIFDVKRFAPGEVTGNSGIVFTHDCTTLGGNSGSPVIDIETGTVVGLHFGGEYLVNNYAVKSSVIRDILEMVTNSEAVAPPPAPVLETFEEKIENMQGRTGYVSNFLGEGQFEVPLPTFGAGLGALALTIDNNAAGAEKFLLKYTHFSIAMHKERRMAIFTADNIDGSQSKKIKRKKDSWGFDPRILKDFQFGNELYEGNDLDRGHLVRRLDPVWGDDAIAKRAELDTFFFTNCTPQHAGFNQKTWLELEEYLLSNIDTRDFKACVFTGPIFSADDRPYRGAFIPLAYWKVVVMIHDQRDELTATAYVISQRELVSNMEFVFGQFKTYQISIADLEQRTNLNFGKLKDFDPLNVQESAGARELKDFESIRLT